MGSSPCKILSARSAPIIAIFFPLADSVWEKYLPSESSKAQTLSTSNPKGYGPYIIGISVVSFKAEDVTAANSKFGSNLTGYNYVYQFNVDNGNIGVVFNRK